MHGGTRYSWGTFWALISAPDRTSSFLTPEYYDTAMPAQLYLNGLVVQIQAKFRRTRYWDLEELALVNMSSSCADTQQNTRDLRASMDTAPSDRMLYTAMLLNYSQYYDSSGNTIPTYNFLLLQELKADSSSTCDGPVEADDNGDSQNASDTNKFERVGMLGVVMSEGKKLEESDWHLQARLREVIVC
jgi:hypothetical protein